MIYGAFWGVTVGEALGLPLCPRSPGDSKSVLVSDYIEFAPSVRLAKGSWSSATSLTLAMIDTMSRKFSEAELMESYRHFFKNWDYSATGLYYQGNQTTLEAIYRSFQRNSPFGCGSPDAVDSGPIQRILPMAFYLSFPYGIDWVLLKEPFEEIHRVCALTHEHPLCKMACGVYLAVANRIISGLEIGDAMTEAMEACQAYYGKEEAFREVFPRFASLFDGSFLHKSVSDIATGDDAADTLTAVLWLLRQTSDFSEALLAAVNSHILKVSPDILGTLVGGLAGIYYGYRSIPKKWRTELAAPEMIETFCDQMFNTMLALRLEKIYPYLEFFKDVSPEPFVTVDHTALLNEQETDENILTMQRFADDFSNYGLARFDYMDILRENRIPLWSEEMTAAVETGKAELTLAILTAYIRIERFRVGTWSEGIEKGVFYRGIQHLAELSSGEQS